MISDIEENLSTILTTNQRETAIVTVEDTDLDLDFEVGPVNDSSPDLIVKLERADGTSNFAQIIQIASDEVRVKTPQALEPGEIVLFSISDQEGHVIWQSPSETHWVHTLGVSSEAGLFFHQRVSAELIAWTRWDRRNQLRYPVRVASRIWWDSQAESVPVMLVNYSSNGIGILTPQPGFVGRNFVLSTCEPSEEMIVVQGNCCWQVSHDRGFMIGCELPPNQGRRFSGRVFIEDVKLY